MPIKLGILLYGPPGTGKSATILAVASYLQKDIFYVDLKGVKTNAELKKLFDHIITVNTNGGILVFEDIDAATTMVHKRSEEIIESNSTDVLSATNDELTLDFFLNLLQGTLTKDNTIFIVTTNHCQKLDPALIRPGRFDIKLQLSYCTTSQLSQMWLTLFRTELNSEILSRFKEEVYTPAEILSVCSHYLTSGEEVDAEEILKQFLRNESSL